MHRFEKHHGYVMVKLGIYCFIASAKHVWVIDHNSYTESPLCTDCPQSGYNTCWRDSHFCHFHTWYAACSFGHCTHVNHLYLSCSGFCYSAAGV